MTELDNISLTDDTKPKLIEAMNSGYKEALKVYAKHFCGQVEASNASIVEIDETSFLLRYWDAQSKYGESVVNFQNAAGDSVTARSAGDVRRILVDMARLASRATGDELPLPCGAAVGSNESEKLPGAFWLNDLVDMNTVECLNQDDEHPVANAVFTTIADAETQTETALQSDPDVDQQLLIKIGFRRPVKLKAISFHGNAEDETAPQIVKVFQGQMHFGFQEAEEQEAVETLTLTPSLVASGDPCTLRYVKFQNVTSLQLFVQSNFGSDVTRIGQLQFWGSPAEAVDMKFFKKSNEFFANPACPVMEPISDGPDSGTGAK